MIDIAALFVFELFEYKKWQNILSMFKKRKVFL